jgi:hypothetical protein
MYVIKEACTKRNIFQYYIEIDNEFQQINNKDFLICINLSIFIDFSISIDFATV